MEAAAAPTPLEAVRPEAALHGLHVRHFSSLAGPGLAKQIEDFLRGEDIVFVSLSYSANPPKPVGGGWRQEALVTYYGPDDPEGEQ